jgi:hypothetical protein
MENFKYGSKDFIERQKPKKKFIYSNYGWNSVKRGWKPPMPMKKKPKSLQKFVQLKNELAFAGQIEFDYSGQKT